jgi:Ca-activated chloride channel family protein
VSLRELLVFPEALPILLAVPILWLLLRLLDRYRTQGLVRGAGPRAHILAADLCQSRRSWRRWLATLALLLALIALLQPLWGEGLRKIKQRGVDILVCLDVSRSMQAKDLPPSRLERARHEVRTLAEQVQGDRMGLVVFAGDARLTVPLTQDMRSFADLVDSTGPLSVGKGGTDLGAALEVALKTLEGQTGDHEVVLLLTDGEDHAQQGLRIAEQCRENNIRIHCVGFGSTRGSKIAVEDESGEAFLRDTSGEEVVSAMDAAGLRRIAEATQGTFMDADARPLPLLKLYEKEILPMARKSFEARGSLARKNRFQWPLLIAFLLWVLNLGLTDRKGK